MSTVIKGGTVVAADRSYEADILIEGETIAAIGDNLAGDKVTHDDTDGPTILDHDVEHLRPTVEFDRSGVDLARERLVGPQQKLLSCLAAGVEGT